MRFHGMMLLRNESDVIIENITHLMTWLDTLHILDLGSTDGTWEIVQELRKQDGRIKPVEHASIVYDDNLRSYVFHQARECYETGDWVLRIDADEFYHITPPVFVKERMRPGDSAAHLQWYFFRLTAAEADDYVSGRVDVAADRSRSITDRRRFYKVSQYAEPRMFRYRRTVQWPETMSFPYNAGFVSAERLPIRHYPHRDPLQMMARFKLRAEMKKHHAGGSGDHWKVDDWRLEVVDESGASEAAARRVGLGGEDGIDVGPLYYWEPGTELAEHRIYSHVPPLMTRAAQRIVHPLLLPLLDRTRKPFDPNFRPKYLA